MKEKNKTLLLALIISTLMVFPQIVYFYMGKTEIDNTFEEFQQHSLTLDKGFWGDPIFYVVISVVFLGQFCIYFLVSYFLIRYLKNRKNKI